MNPLCDGLKVLRRLICESAVPSIYYTLDLHLLLSIADIASRVQGSICFTCV